MSDLERAGIIIGILLSLATLVILVTGWLRGWFKRSIDVDSVILNHTDHTVTIAKHSQDIKDADRRLTYLEVKHEKDMKQLGEGIEEKIKAMRLDLDSKLVDIKHTFLEQIRSQNVNALQDAAETRALLEKMGERQYKTAEDMGGMKASMDALRHSITELASRK